MIRLLPALWWECPNCKKRNLEIPELLHVGDPDFADPYELLSSSDESDDDDCQSVMAQARYPEYVICPVCFVSFPTSPPV